MADAYSSGMRGAEKGHRGEVQEVTIQPAANGYTVRCVHKIAGGPGLAIGESAKPSVFQDLDGALRFAREELERGGEPKGKRAH